MEIQGWADCCGNRALAVMDLLHQHPIKEQVKTLTWIHMIGRIPKMTGRPTSPTSPCINVHLKPALLAIVTRAKCFLIKCMMELANMIDGIFSQALLMNIIGLGGDWAKIH